MNYSNGYIMQDQVHDRVRSIMTHYAGGPVYRKLRLSGQVLLIAALTVLNIMAVTA